MSIDRSPRAALQQMCVFGALAYCSYAMCRIPLLPLLARDLGAGPAMVGLIMGASTLAGVVIKLPAGAWSDVLGRRPLLVAAAVVFAATPFAYLAVASVGALIAVRFVHGSATAIAGPVASAAISDAAPSDRRATWLAIYSTVQGAGQAIGPVLAGYLIAIRRYDVAFLLAGGLALPTVLIATRWPVPVTAPSAGGRSRLPNASAIVAVLRHPVILATSGAQSALFMLNGSLNAFLPLFASDALGFTASQLGWMFALQTVMTIVSRPLVGAAADHIDRRAVIVIGLTVCAAAGFVVASADRGWQVVAAVIMYAAGVAATGSAATAYITDHASRAQYGAAHGVFGSIYDVGDALGPMAAGVMVASFGYPDMFRTMAAIALSGAAAFSVVVFSQKEHPRWISE